MRALALFCHRLLLAGLALILAEGMVVAQGAPALPDPLDAAITSLTKRRADAWSLAQQRKDRIPKDSQWPGAVGAEANQSLGYVEAADFVLDRLVKARAVPAGPGRTSALARLKAELEQRRQDNWQRSQEEKRLANPNMPDRFGATLNQQIGMVEAFDDALKVMAVLAPPPPGAIGGSYSGPLVLRTKLSATRGTLRLTVQGARVTGVIEAKATHTDGSTVTQRVEIAGSIDAGGTLTATARGSSRYQSATPDKPFSSLAGAIYNYTFTGAFNGVLTGTEGSGTMDLRGIGNNFRDMVMTDRWTVTRAP